MDNISPKPNPRDIGHTTEPKVVDREPKQPYKRSLDEVLLALADHDWKVDTNLVSLVYNWGERETKATRDSYPGWKLEDFVELLDRLGIDYDKNRVDIEQINRQRELGEKRMQLSSLQHDLSKLIQSKIYPLAGAYEKMLEHSQKDIIAAKDGLSKMKLLDRLMFDKISVRNFKDRIETAIRMIKEYEERIKNSPLEQRKLDDQRKEEEKKEKIKKLSKEIETLEMEIHNLSDN